MLQAIASSRFKLVVLVGALWLFHASVANAQISPTRYFEHDRALDGTPAEIVGGFFSLVAGAGTPDEQRYAVPDFLEFFDDNNNFTPPPYGGRAAYSWETRTFTVAPGTQNGSFTVTMHWANPNVDFDLYVYRRNADGSVGPDPVASSAAGGTIQEAATYVPDSIPDPDDPNSFDPGTVEPGTYVVYFDNWCSNENDPLDRELAEFIGGPACLQGGYTDEDDWTGNVTFADPESVNKLPFDVQINGNKSGTVGDTLTFTASAKDRDATTDPPRFTYSFDLDGDGNFDYNSANSATVAKRFDTPGTYNVGVRVLDEDGGAGYASMAVTINGVPQALPAPIPAKPTPVAPLSSFTLGKPVFGGSNNRSLVVSYRLREASTVTVALYRGSRRIRTLSTGSRSANRTYRLTVKATRSLSRGTYTIRLGAKTADGRTQNARLSAKRL